MQGASISIHSLVAVGFLVIICIFPKVKKAGYHFMHACYACYVIIGFGKSAHAPTKCGIPQPRLRLSINEYEISAINSSFMAYDGVYLYSEIIECSRSIHHTNKSSTYYSGYI